MKGTLGAGSAWGVPIRGGIVSLDSADVSDILGAASGLASTLVKASAIGLGISLVGAFLMLSALEQRIPITSLANVSRGGRKFKGVCLNKEFTFKCDNQTVTFPSDYVRTIKPGGFLSIPEVVTIDGSTYWHYEFIDDELQFLTLGGIQTVNVNDYKTSIYGNTIQEVDQLRNNLVFALENNAEEVVKRIGKNIFERHFYLGT